METIRVKMARGGSLVLLADGHVYNDSYGSGEKFIGLDDFQLYWPRKTRDKKLYPVRDELIADMSAAEQDYIDAVLESSRDPY